MNHHEEHPQKKRSENTNDGSMRPFKKQIIHE